MRRQLARRKRGIRRIRAYFCAVGRGEVVNYLGEEVHERFRDPAVGLVYRVDGVCDEDPLMSDGFVSALCSTETRQ